MTDATASPGSARHLEELRADARACRRESDASSRRDPCAARRQRRWKVDAVARHFRPRQPRRRAKSAIAARRSKRARPREALDAGIAMVMQETSLAPDLSVLENIFLPDLGRPGRLSRPTMRRRAERDSRRSRAGARPFARRRGAANSPRRSVSSSRSQRRWR